jgi:hypothetical protein
VNGGQGVKDVGDRREGVDRKKVVLEFEGETVEGMPVETLGG